MFNSFHVMKKIRLFFTAMVLLIFSVAVSAQNITVTGTVSDESGAAVAGAGVLLKGNNTVYTMTDNAGQYRISVPANGTLTVNCLGYQDTEVNVAGQSVINIVLIEDKQMLEETIVVAYGTATKSSFTGSAAMVKSESIEKKISANVTNALAGTTPGVQIISGSGDPTSSSPTIRIRGIGSMSASNSPLIVVDGMPYEGSISDINPNDVESMSVLKDASASAIYGHRGANGVVLITTKKASSGDAQVKFDARFGVNSRLIPQYDVITDPAEYYETYYKMMYNQYYYAGHTSAESYEYADKYIFDQNNGGLGYQVYTVPEGEKFIGTNFKLNPKATLGYYDGTYYYTPDNWYKEAFHNSFRQEYNVSVSGSSDRFNYYASAGILNDGGMVSNSNYKRYTGRVNADYQVKKWFKVSTSLNYSHSNSQVADYDDETYGSSGNIFYIVNNMGPIYPLYVRKLDEDGNPYILTENGRTVYDSNNTNFKRPNFVGNAIRDNEVDDRHNYADVLVGKWGAVFTPVEGLTLSANLGITDDNTRSTELYSQFGSASSDDGQVYVEHNRLFTVNQQYLAEYKKNIAGTEHSIDILAGYEQYKKTSQLLYGQNDHLFNPLIGELSNADGTEKKTVKSYTNEYMTEGFLARAQYDYAGKYFASASFRRDASSRFAKGHRWGNFGSLGAAWLVTREDFMKDVSWVDMLKLKVSYGIQGNDNLGTRAQWYYPYADQYTHSYNSSTNEYSMQLAFKGNSELTWETSKSFNIGTDFELLKGALNGSIELFTRKTEDLLYSKDVPLSAGNPTGVIPVNVGSIMNKGIEVTLDGSIINTRDVNWTWNLNLSHYSNKILSLDDSVSEEGIKQSYRIYKVGGSLYELYIRKYAGVDPESGKALYYYDEKDDDGNVIATMQTTSDFSKATQYEDGSILPKLYGGFGTSVSAYGFDLSAQFSYQLGGRYYDGSYQALMHTQASAGQAWHRDVLKAWTPDNTNTDVPRLDGDIQVAQAAVDRFLISSNYLSINNVTLGYTVPARLVKKAGIGSLRVYVSGENLAVFTARKGVDPRFAMGIGSYTAGSGLSTGGYGAMRNITGGITLTF